MRNTIGVRFPCGVQRLQRDVVPSPKRVDTSKSDREFFGNSVKLHAGHLSKNLFSCANFRNCTQRQPPSTVVYSSKSDKHIFGFFVGQNGHVDAEWLVVSGSGPQVFETEQLLPAAFSLLYFALCEFQTMPNRDRLFKI